MNIIEENNESDNKSDSEKKKRNRPCKNERYESERKELIKELEKLMGLTEEKRGVLLYDLEHNEVLKEYLKDKVPEIKKMFKCGCWGFFSKDKKQGMGNEIGLLKSIFKNENYNITNKRILCIKGEVKKLYMELYFNKI